MMYNDKFKKLLSRFHYLIILYQIISIIKKTLKTESDNTLFIIYFVKNNSPYKKNQIGKGERITVEIDVYSNRFYGDYFDDNCTITYLDVDNKRQYKKDGIFEKKLQECRFKIPLPYGLLNSVVQKQIESTCLDFVRNSKKQRGMSDIPW